MTVDGDTGGVPSAEGPSGLADKPDLAMPVPTSERYPDHLMPFVGSEQEQDQRFADAVEAFLVNYGYNTARAYLADLEDIYLWAQGRGVDFFELTEAQLRQYQGLLRRRKYSEGTVRRRLTAWRGLRRITSSALRRSL